LGKDRGNDSAELWHFLLFEVSRHFDCVRRVEAEKEEKGEEGGDMHIARRDGVCSTRRAGELEVALGMGSEDLEAVDVVRKGGRGARRLTEEEELLESVRRGNFGPRGGNFED
jgi:hypothetical protein